LAGCTGDDDQTDDPAGSEATRDPTPTETSHRDDDHHDEEGESHHDEEVGGSNEHGHDHEVDTPAEPSATATVSMETADGGKHYAPHVVWIEQGGSVTWELESGDHTATAYHPDNDRPLRIPEAARSWDSGLLSDDGATFERGFEVEGVYDYVCTPHEDVGMVGTIIVGSPHPHDLPGLEAPDGSHPEAARERLKRLNEAVKATLDHSH